MSEPRELRHHSATTGSGLPELIAAVVGVLIVSVLCAAVALACVGIGGF